MIRHSKRSSKQALEKSIDAAEKVIALFHHVVDPTEEQKATLASAYYTLAIQPKLSHSRSKMYLNSAIALLQNLEERKSDWNVQIARAYFNRAENLESEGAFILAVTDYLHAIEVLNHLDVLTEMDDDDRVLMAQACISIADLIVNDQVTKQDLPIFHPLFYVNTALEYLNKVDDLDEDIWIIRSYAHQIAGISLSATDFRDAEIAYHLALHMAFHADPENACPVLADIYTCLGLLFEQKYQANPIQKTPYVLYEQGSIYFSMSLLFSPNDPLTEDLDTPNDSEDILVLESLFEMIYRVLDPYLSPLPQQNICDLIDALIYVYTCLSDKALPNQALSQHLSQSTTLDTFAQHLYWLVTEAYRKNHPGAELLEISDPTTIDISIDRAEIMNMLKNKNQENICYLKNEYKAKVKTP